MGVVVVFVVVAVVAVVDGACGSDGNSGTIRNQIELNSRNHTKVNVTLT